MAEKGVQHPSQEIIAVARQLIAALSVMPPGAKVRLEIQAGKTRFIAASTDDLLAEHDST